MSDNHPVDPSGNTEAFRAFSSQPPEPARSSSNVPLIAGAAVVVLALVALLIWLVVS